METRPTSAGEANGRDRLGRWLPGSGDVGAHSRHPEDQRKIKAALRLVSEEMVQVIVDLARDSKDDRIRLHAAISLLDRLYGRPHVSVEVSTGEANSLLAALVRSREAKDVAPVSATVDAEVVDPGTTQEARRPSSSKEPLARPPAPDTPVDTRSRRDHASPGQLLDVASIPADLIDRGR